MEQIEKRESLVGSPCQVCSSPDRDEINRLLANGATLSHLAIKFFTNRRGDRAHIERHVSRCLRSTALRMRLENRITQNTDVDRHFDVLLEEAHEIYFAAKNVLMLDGELNMNPRDYEVTIVYSDHNDRTAEGKPKTKSAKLSWLLSAISERGYEPQFSYIKSEDARKGLRDALALAESIIDRKAKTTGAYQDNRRNEVDAFEEAKRMARRNADKHQTTYAHELQWMVDNYDHRFTPALRGMLLKECLDTSAPLARPDRAGFSPLPVTESGPEGIEDLKDQGPARVIETKQEKNSGIFSPEV